MLITTPKASIFGFAVLAIGFAGGFFSHNVVTGTPSAVTQSPVSRTATPTFNVPKQVVQLPGNIMAYVIPSNEESQYKDIKVTDAKGNQVVLDATKQPVFVMSYSNSDSVSSLKMLTQAGASPVIVSTGFQGNGVDLSEAVSDTEKSLQSVALSSQQPLYALSPVPVLSAFPLLITQYQGKLIEVLGKLPNSPQWPQIMGSSHA